VSSVLYNIVSNKQKSTIHQRRRRNKKRDPKDLFALSVRRIFLAETAIFAECKLFFHLFLIAFGVMRDTATQRTLQFYHRIFYLSHISVDY